MQASSVGGWRGGCARKEVLVQAAQHVSGGGSQQLTYLDVEEGYALVLAVLVRGREGEEIGCCMYCLWAHVHVLVVGLCN